MNRDFLLKSQLWKICCFCEMRTFSDISFMCCQRLFTLNQQWWKMKHSQHLGVCHRDLSYSICETGKHFKHQLTGV